jgi:hypothetical protein
MTRKQYSFHGRLDTGDSDPTKLAQAAESLRVLGAAHFAAHEDGGELVVMLEFSAADEVSARTRGVDAVYDAIEGQGLSWTAARWSELSVQEADGLEPRARTKGPDGA